MKNSTLHQQLTHFIFFNMKYRIVKYISKNTRGITETFWRVEKKVLFWWQYLRDCNPVETAVEFVYEKFNSK